MKKILGLICVFMTVLSLHALNVKDFGAKGDGKTDDTKAIQAALNEARKKELYFRAGADEATGWKGHPGLGGYCKVYFPAGTYVISNTLVYNSRKILLEAEKGTVIKQVNPEKDIFYFHTNFRAQVRNFTFDGGACQLNFFTGNGDMSGLDIVNCHFKNSSSFAILGETRRQGTKVIAPYKVAWNKGTPVLTPNDMTNVGYWAFSSLFTVRNCEFENCFQVGVFCGDTFLMENSTIKMNEKSSDTAVVLRGNCHIKNVKGFWKTAKPEIKTWFYSTTQCNIIDSEFDNSSDKGILLVCSKAKAGYISKFLTVDNCKVKCAGNPYNAIIRIEKGTLPNLISITNVTERTGKTVQALYFDEEPTKELFDKELRYRPWRLCPDNELQKVKLGGNSSSIKTDLPAFLRTFTVPFIPEKIYKQAMVKAYPVDFWPELADYPKTLYVKKADEFEIQKALNSAVPGTKVVIPYGKIIIENTLKVPGGVAVVGDGLPLLMMKKGVNKPIMQVADAGKNFIGDISFAQGSEAVIFAKDKNAVSVIENCGFFNQSNCSVVVPESKAVRMSLCVFYSGGGLDSSAEHTEFTANWMNNIPQMNEKALFINRKGEMLSKFNLGVPILPRISLFTSKPDPKNAHITDCGNNVRWFDNYGKLQIYHTRFGGEFGGMTPVWNFTDTGSVLIDGNFVWFSNLYVKHCMVYCVEKPSLVVLNNLISCRERKIKGLYNIHVKDKITGKDIKNPSSLNVYSSAIIHYDK
ncbi:MAG: hypothetical protein IKB71_12375 [Lentisphaeria bacterium]|nr:hypothetical protein [Lentisphaeria bacterium]